MYNSRDIESDPRFTPVVLPTSVDVKQSPPNEALALLNRFDKHSILIAKVIDIVRSWYHGGVYMEAYDNAFESLNLTLRACSIRNTYNYMPPRSTTIPMDNICRSIADCQLDDSRKLEAWVSHYKS